jgi:hypothetical protein
VNTPSAVLGHWPDGRLSNAAAVWQRRIDDLTGDPLFRLRIGIKLENYGKIIIEQDYLDYWRTNPPHEPHYRLKITKADPKVLVAQEILEGIHYGIMHAADDSQVPNYEAFGIRLENVCGGRCILEPNECNTLFDVLCFRNALLHIDTHVWRISEYLPESHAWVATWPD